MFGRKKEISLLFNLPVLLWVLLQSFCSVSLPGFIQLQERLNEGPHLEKSSAIKYDLTRSVQRKWCQIAIAGIILGVGKILVPVGSGMIGAVYTVYGWKLNTNFNCEHNCHGNRRKHRLEAPSQGKRSTQAVNKVHQNGCPHYFRHLHPVFQHTYNCFLFFSILQATTSDCTLTHIYPLFL